MLSEFILQATQLVVHYSAPFIFGHTTSFTILDVLIDIRGVPGFGIHDDRPCDTSGRLISSHLRTAYPW